MGYGHSQGAVEGSCITRENFMWSWTRRHPSRCKVNKGWDALLLGCSKLCPLTGRALDPEAYMEGPSVGLGVCMRPSESSIAAWLTCSTWGLLSWSDGDVSESPVSLGVAKVWVAPPSPRCSLQCRAHLALCCCPCGLSRMRASSGARRSLPWYRHRGQW